MNMTFAILTVIILLPLVVSLVWNLTEWLIQYINYKKWIFSNSDNYIVGFPSGEVIFVENDDTFRKLREKELITWLKEYRCYCYRDYELIFIKKIIKFK